MHARGIPGPGGWAWAIAPDGAVHGSGGEAHTTNQRMEMQAVLEALRSNDGQLTIVSDSHLRGELLPRRVVGAVAGERLEELEEGAGGQHRPVEAADRAVSRRASRSFQLGEGPLAATR